VILAIGVLTLAAGCREEIPAGVLVNVQLDSTTVQVSQLRLRGYLQGEVADALEMTRSLPSEGLFGQTENLFVMVPRAWINRTVWIAAEGVHEGVVTAHGRTSVSPEKSEIVEATLLLVAGPPPCGNGFIDGPEQCDGENLAGQTCAQVTGAPHGVLGCADCQLDVDGCHDCGNGEIEAGPEQCDGETLAGQTCASQGFVTGTLSCGGDCQLDRSDCVQGCGNGVIEGGEACDGLDLAHLGCVDLGYLRGPLLCTADCELDDSDCAGGCGDGVLDPGEECDATDLGNQTCLTAAGRTEGVLACTGTCHLDVSDCHRCGNGVIEAHERCDGPSLGGETCATQGLDSGTLTCDTSCLLDTSACGVILSSCGDGVVSVSEQCDDGNLTVGDGCDGSCLMEPGFHCYDTPSTCVSDIDVLFVDCDVPCGGTGLLTDPYCAIQDAANAAVNGDLIWLLPSTCVESVTVDTTDIIISGDANAQWIGVPCPALTVEGRQVLLWRVHVQEGITAFGASTSLQVFDSEIGPGIDDCEAVYCYNDAHCRIERNHIHDNVEGGIWVIDASFQIVNNIIVKNGAPGTSFRGGVSLSAAGYTPALLANNTIAYNMSKSGTFISGVRCVEALEIHNNIIWMNNSSDVSTLCIPWYSDISSATWDGIQGNINLPPLFVDAPGGDYHIQTTSPCVDTGDPAGIPVAPNTDIDGDTRPLGDGVDIGADEAS
jgi:cysteine-rich repeat protein